MDRARVWPDFRDAWIVYEDDDLLAVDKPVGVSSQAADSRRPDDLVTRLKRHLTARGVDDYLGTHQRLDRDTSGVIVFTRRRAANAKIAAQFEGRAAKKTYLAAVSGWPRGRERATLRDGLVAGPGGSIRVVPTGRPGAQLATTHVRVVGRRGDRAMLELHLETGRTHQARVQLAHAGAPIAGDALYGGAAAPRLMLHSAALALEHPSSGHRLRLDAPAPPELAAWVEHGDLGEKVYDDTAALDRALGRALERRWGLGRSDALAPDDATTAFRLAHESGDALPRLAVDVYDGWLVAQFYGDDGPWADRTRRETVLDRLAALGFDGIYEKVRPKQANVVVDTRRPELAPRAPVRGRPAPDEFAIREEGVPLLVRLGDGLSTGLFLDQRANRKRVRELASGKRVANLFAYTCAFTVAAALGGASGSVSVDASLTALERGRANLVQAGILPGAAHVFVADDAFGWLAKAGRRGERFDLIVLDPPSYSTTRRGRFVATDDYVELAASALALIRGGGHLLACTNHRGISPSRFRHILIDACRTAGLAGARVKDLGAPSDFPVAAGDVAHAKSVLVSI